MKMSREDQWLEEVFRIEIVPLGGDMLVLGSVYNGKICIVAFYIKAVGKPWLVKVDWLVVGSALFACVPVHNLQISTVIFTVEWKRCAQIWKKKHDKHVSKPPRCAVVEENQIFQVPKMEESSPKL